MWTKEMNSVFFVSKKHVFLHKISVTAHNNISA